MRRSLHTERKLGISRCEIEVDADAVSTLENVLAGPRMGSRERRPPRRPGAYAARTEC